MSVESDFGYGKSSVINCENNITRQIQFLLDTAPCVENGDFEENLKAMDMAVMNINSLLRRRTELKNKKEGNSIKRNDTTMALEYQTNLVHVKGISIFDGV